MLIRWLFVAIVLLIPAQIVLLRAAHGEPYPAVFMPSFGSVPQVDNYVTVSLIEVQATTVDGQTFDLEPPSLIPNRTLLGESIATQYFASQRLVEATARSGWLAAQLSSQFPGRVFITLSVTHSTYLVNSSTLEREVTEVRNFVVDLERVDA